MRLLVLLAWSLLVAAGTRLLGWWAVPIVGGLAPLVAATLGAARAPRQGRSVARGVALAAVLGWALLLGWAAAGPQFGAVSGLVGALLRAPWPAVALATLLLPALLAWSAAALVEGALAVARLPASDEAPFPSPSGRSAPERALTPPRSTVGLP